MFGRSQRWLRSGLVLGAVVAGAAYYWHHVRDETETHNEECATGDRHPITERHAGAFLVRRRIELGQLESVRGAIQRRHQERDEDWLLGIDEVTTASLFLDRIGEHPELVWYVEVPWPAVETGDNLAATLDDAFPVIHDAIRDVDEPVDQDLLVHAVHPSRPETVVPVGVDRGDRSARENDPTVEVELVRMDLKPGLPERLADWFTVVSRRVINGDLRFERLEVWSVEMLEAEAMFTESVVLERRDDGYSLVGYMETAEMSGVYDAYYDTWNPVARASEVVLERILVNPDVILSYPLTTDTELLTHATASDRPRLATDIIPADC